jgi:hypothetical protein
MGKEASGLLVWGMNPAVSPNLTQAMPPWASWWLAFDL